MKFGLNGFIIARDTEKEARDTLREIVEKANRPAVEGFRDAVQQRADRDGEAAAAFGGVMAAVLASDAVSDLLLKIVEKALAI